MPHKIPSPLMVYHTPPSGALPARGGVGEHCRQLLKHLQEMEGVEITYDFGESHISHVQSSYSPPAWARLGAVARPSTKIGLIDVYTCHGGFLPYRIEQVDDNLRWARVIVSVADWIVDRFFPEWREKTVVIPNGVDLREWENLPPSGLEPGYFLWGKEVIRPDWWDFLRMAQMWPDFRFVTTLCPPGVTPPRNMAVIGLQLQKKMRSVINDCAVYVSTGSEVCPTMVLEAWACSKPVLASDLHGNREVLLQRDPTSSGLPLGGRLYRHMRDVGLDVYYLREELGAEGRAIVEERYQWKDLAAQTVELYRDFWK